MKKTILTMMVVVMTMIGASAQNFTVVSTYLAPTEGESYSTDNFTNNLGVMYKCADKCSIGLTKNNENYDLIGRYNYSDNVYVSLQAPTEEVINNLSVGVGYSLPVWNGICVEPNYTMNVSADDTGERAGSFNLGISFKF